MYYAKFTPGVHESVLNKLTYDTELESIYITGNFGVKMVEDYILGERRCIHRGKKFSLVKPIKDIDISYITRQNFWFFSGVMHLNQKIIIKKDNLKQYIFSFKKLNAPAAQIFVNGSFVGNIIFAPFVIDVTDQLIDGENEFEIVMLSGN